MCTSACIFFAGRRRSASRYWVRSAEKRSAKQFREFLIVIAMRQKLLAIPGKLYSRLGNERFAREAAQLTETCILEVLNELAKLPECAEPDWEEQLEEEESGPKDQNAIGC